MAANMGALAESFGMRQGLKYRGDIKDALLTVLKLDPAFQQGSADRALGRWYYKVPGLFGGSNKKSEEHLRKSLTYDPKSTASHFFLAETLFDLDRDDEARAELQRVLDAPLDPEWAPEDREFKEKAQALLEAKVQRTKLTPKASRKSSSLQNLVENSSCESLEPLRSLAAGSSPITPFRRSRRCPGRRRCTPRRARVSGLGGGARARA